MHYTSMIGMRVEGPRFAYQGRTERSTEGATAFEVLLPLIVVLFVFMLICSLFLLLSAAEDRPREAERSVRTARRRRAAEGRPSSPITAATGMTATFPLAPCPVPSVPAPGRGPQSREKARRAFSATAAASSSSSMPLVSASERKVYGTR